MNYHLLFESIFPGFFQNAGIPDGGIFTELVMDLRKGGPHDTASGIPKGITFCEDRAGIDALREAVSQVEEDWLPYFHEETPVFCAFDRGRIVAFCILSDWGCHQDLRIGGPGCVGTIPEYRGKGIGLELVRQATNLLKEKGFDLSWIHYTHLEHWYQKLGYQAVLRWDCKGILPGGEKSSGENEEPHVAGEFRDHPRTMSKESGRVIQEHK